MKMYHLEYALFLKDKLRVHKESTTSAPHQDLNDVLRNHQRVPLYMWHVVRQYKDDKGVELKSKLAPHSRLIVILHELTPVDPVHVLELSTRSITTRSS
jgi:hypothetical protein